MLDSMKMSLIGRRAFALGIARLLLGRWPSKQTGSDRFPGRFTLAVVAFTK